MQSILDPCCGSRMMWFDKQDQRCLFGDRRAETHLLKDRQYLRHLEICPDVRLDFRNLPFADGTFKVVVFDPPHLVRAGKKSWLALKYGRLGNDWRDDIRQWVNMPSEMLAEVQRIGQLSGADFGGKYLVAEAPSEDALLMKTAELGRALQPLVAQGKLVSFQSPDQLLMPVSEQKKLQNRLRELSKLPESRQPLVDIGTAVVSDQPIAEIHEANGGAVVGTIRASLDGIVRGVLYPGLTVKSGLKVMDIDPRGDPAHCFSVSDKALSIAGGVLEAILTFYATKGSSRENRSAAQRY